MHAVEPKTPSKHISLSVQRECKKIHFYSGPLLEQVYQASGASQVHPAWAWTPRGTIIVAVDRTMNDNGVRAVTNTSVKSDLPEGEQLFKWIFIVRMKSRNVFVILSIVIVSVTIFLSWLLHVRSCSWICKKVRAVCWWVVIFFWTKASQENEIRHAGSSKQYNCPSGV